MWSGAIASAQEITAGLLTFRLDPGNAGINLTPRRDIPNPHSHLLMSQLTLRQNSLGESVSNTSPSPTAHQRLSL